eukprot:5366358-Amphidinium_carterae.2
MEEQRLMAIEANRRIQQSAKDTDVNMDNDADMDTDVNMNDRPVVTTIPPSTETPLPKVSSASSLGSDSTIDRDQIDIAMSIHCRTDDVQDRDQSTLQPIRRGTSRIGHTTNNAPMSSTIYIYRC